MITAILFILMMLILIAPHEFGHFIVAKLVGVKVNEFAIGMGPLIWSRQKGETKYSLRAIPIGGYNAMEGEDADSEDPRGFNCQTPLKRIAILIAGVAMNVLIAIIICTIIVQMSGVAINTLDSVSPKSPAAVAGLEAGDKIVAVNGETTKCWESVTTAIDKFNPDSESSISMTIKRDGKDVPVTVVPEYNEEAGRYMIGITAAISKNPIRCLGGGLTLTIELNNEMFKSFGMLFSGKASTDDVSGPVGLVKVVNQTTQMGIQSYLLLLALVSLNLALINMLPIPALDGGKILFVIIKAISRGKVTDEMEYKATMIGFTLLLMLVAFVTVNDIGNLFGL